jgi:uncharacterized damage-inducible protein DinB
MTANLGELVRTALIGELEGLRDGIREATGPLSEPQFWSKPLEPGNSVGHLVLHLTGNLNHFVGAQLGNTGYVRQREREFTDPNPPTKADALSRLDDAVALFRRIVGGLDDDALARPHPEARFGTVVKTLIHLVAHFALHRGQISYIARLAVRPG